MKALHYTISYFMCPTCKHILPLPRNKSVKRKKGHIKDLYCIYCNKITEAIEMGEDRYITQDGVKNYV